MRPIVYVLALISIMLVTAEVQAQQKPVDNKQREQRFYQQSLQVDSIKASQVAQIMDRYKAAMKEVEQNPGLTEDQKRERYKALIDGKNVQLQDILSEEQQQRIIPLSERRSSMRANRDSTVSTPITR